jgi:mannose/fructose/N-acetylgalactosamine-specific phosphotransferase system component IIC
MKKQVLAGIMAIFLMACEKDDVEKDTVQVAVPVTMTIADFRASVEIIEPGKLNNREKYILMAITYL